MTEEVGSGATRYLPHAVLATLVVALLPVAVVWGARADRLISSPWLCVGVTVALSLLASAAGNWSWKRRPGSGDVLFSDLLLWGWLRRVRVEHQLADATKALGLVAPAADRGEDDLEHGPGVDADQRLELLTQLANALEAHDPYVDGHSRRVARHASMIARTLGLPADEIAQIRRAATVHDVGKLRLPREVLMKPTVLTDAEFEVIKRHSTEGAEMVDCLGDPELTAMVRHHHERMDGSGYPAGLHGTEIPLGARIIAVADTFDAITSARPYRPPARHKQAIDILVSEAGVRLDAAAVRAFVSYYSGSRVLVLWAILAAVPQRAIDWTRRIGGASRTVSATPSAAGAAATLVIGAAAVIPPFGLGHLSAHAAGRHQTPFAQLAATSVAAAPIALGGASRTHTRRPGRTTRRGVRGGVRANSAPHRSAGLPVIRTAPRSLRAPARARNRSGRGQALPGHGLVGQSNGAPGVPPPYPGGGGSGGGHGGGGSGGRGGGSGGGSSPATTNAPVAAPPGGPGTGTVSGTGGATGGTTGPAAGANTTAASGGTTTGATGAGSGGATGGTTNSAGTGAGTTGSTGTGATGGTGTGATGGTGPGTPGPGTTGPGTTGGTPGGGPPPSPQATKGQCMDGGYAAYGFKNQGLCVAAVAQQSPPSGKP